MCATSRCCLGLGLVLTMLASTATDAHAQLSQPVGIMRNVTLAAPPAAATARQNDTGGIGVGVLGGFTRARLQVEDFGELFDTRNGFMLGAWVGGNRNGRVGFVGEFIYVFRRADTPLGELKYPAVEIPAVLHINFGSEDPGGVRGYGLVGPVFTLNLKQKLNGVDLDDDEGFKGADIGVMGGGGVEFFRVGIEVRGNWGLRNINSEGDVAEVKTRAVELIFKFRFN